MGEKRKTSTHTTKKEMGENFKMILRNIACGDGK
jgi:hypothetical protein